jgi:hypothetical protein
MNKTTLNNAPAPRSVDQQQACSALDALQKMCSFDHNLLLWCSSDQSPNFRYYAWSKKLGAGLGVCDAESGTLAGAILELYRKHGHELCEPNAEHSNSHPDKIS